MKQRRDPIRTCIACQSKRPQREMLRIAHKDGQIRVDHGSGLPGRGMYICKEGDCLQKAFKTHAFQRAIKRQLKEEEKRYIIDEIQKQGKS